MLDLNYIRDHAEDVKKAMTDLYATAPVDEILSLDVRRRELLQVVESLRAQRNTVSKEISGIKNPAQRQPLVDEMRQVGDRIRGLEGELKGVDERLTAALYECPTCPRPACRSVPDETPQRPSAQSANRASLISSRCHTGSWARRWASSTFERGVKISGTRFYVLKGAGARLQRALIAWMLDLHTREHGYTEIYPPSMVKRASAWWAPATCPSSATTSTTTPRRTSGGCPPPRCR